MIAPVVRLTELKPHPNADKVEIAVLSNGLEVVVGFHYRPNILGVYFPPGVWLPGYLADDLWLFGYATAMRSWFEVREITLRGVKSPGMFGGCVYRKDAHDARSVARYAKLQAEGGELIGGPHGSIGEPGWVRWPYWRQGWREGDDVGIYLGVVPDYSWDHEYGMGPPKLDEP